MDLFFYQHSKQNLGSEEYSQEEANDSQDAEFDDVSVTLSLEYSDIDSQQSEDVDCWNSNSGDNEDEWGTHNTAVTDFNFDCNKFGILIDLGETTFEIFNSLWNKNVNDILHSFHLIITFVI